MPVYKINAPFDKVSIELKAIYGEIPPPGREMSFMFKDDKTFIYIATECPISTQYLKEKFDVAEINPKAEYSKDEWEYLPSEGVEFF